MDIRSPDSYIMETLVESNSPNSPNLSQDISCHELELAMIESLEEVWVKDATNAVLWESFQPFLERLKRIGHYDSEIQKIHELLSILLYKYSYQIEDFLSEENYQWIEKHLKTVRISLIEREELTKAFNHLRYGL